MRQFRSEGERPLKVPSPPAPTAVFTGVGGRALAALVETLRQRVNAPINASKIPAQKPVFSQIIVEQSGHLWVTTSAPSGTPGTRFDVFDPEGRFLGSLSTDLRISQLWIRGDKVYGVHQDEFDVPFVVRLRIGGR